MARAPKAAMEPSERLSNSGEEVAVAATDSPKDQMSWAQYLHDSQFFDLSSFSPRGLISPRGDLGGFPDLSMVCPSPMFSDQLKFLQSWSSPKVINSEPSVGANTSSLTAPVVAGDQMKSMQCSDLARAGQSECVSTSVSVESEPSSSNELGKVNTSESTGSGEDAGKGSKRKSVDRDEETNDGSEGEEDLEVENHVHKSVKQQKMKGPKRLREPRYSIKTRTEVDIMDDGYKWRKYGQKPVKNSPHPRNYYRCTTPNCPVRKRVERSTEDSGLVVTSYEGTHIHPKVTQPKRTPSGNYAYEPAESLSDALNQINQRQQQAAANSTTSALPPSNLGSLPNLSQLFSGWPPLMNRPAAMPAVGPSLHDNVGLMMAYQIVRLQWELQSKVQQFMSYNAQQGLGGALPKMNPFMNPFLDSMGSGVPDFSALLQNFGEGSEAEEFERPKLPKVPESLPSSLLSRRAALRSGSPLNPNVQNAMKMQQLMSQAMAGYQQAALDQQESLGEIADRGLVSDRRGL